jgi:hypothetical protein
LPSTVASKFLSLDPIKPSGFDNLVSVNWDSLTPFDVLTIFF